MTVYSKKLKEQEAKKGSLLDYMAASAVMMLLAACAMHAAKTDWQTRIGHHSLDDATRELGPPESCVGLDNGGTVCSWARSNEKNRIDKLILTFDQNMRLATADEVQL